MSPFFRPLALPLPTGKSMIPKDPTAPPVGGDAVVVPQPESDRVSQGGFTPSRALCDHLVDEPIVLGLVGRQEVIALGVALDSLQRLAGPLGEDLVERRARLEDLV